MISKMQIFRLLAIVAVFLTVTTAKAVEIAEASNDAVAIVDVVESAVEEVEFSILREAFLFKYGADQTEPNHTDSVYMAQMHRLDTLLKSSPIKERDVVNVVATTSFDIYMSFLTNLSITSAFNLREKFLLEYPEVDPAQVKSYYYCNPWQSVADRLEESDDFVERADVLDIMRSNDNPYAIEYLLKALYSSSLDVWLFIDQAMSDTERYGMIYIMRESLEDIPEVQLNDSAYLAERVPEDEDLAAVRESFNYIEEEVDEILENKNYFLYPQLDVDAIAEISADGDAAADGSDVDSADAESVASRALADGSDAADSQEEDGGVGIPVLALKTNLLFDALTLLNAEIEIPIGDKFSIAGEIMFPWWTNDSETLDSKRNRTQLLTGTFEARYWMGDRAERARLTHWFLGAYGGFGKFDYERSHIGYQSIGRFYDFGVSLGYAHKVAKRLRMEYSIGVGYFNTKYTKYESQWSTSAQEWQAIRTDVGSLEWFGPTRAKVSLSILLHKKANKKSESTSEEAPLTLIGSSYSNSNSVNDSEEGSANNNE